MSNKQSSISIISSLLSCMIGSTILLYPIFYRDYGILLSQLVLTVATLVHCKSCILVYNHTKSYELELSQIALRKLGKKYVGFYTLASALNQSIMCLTYCIITINLGYKILEFSLQKYGITIASKDVFTFSEFSLQYFSIILMTVQYIIFQVRDIETAIKYSRFGMLGILAYVIMIMVNATASFQEQLNTKSAEDIVSGFNLWSEHLGLAVASMSQSILVIAQMVAPLQTNVDKSNNIRDIKLFHLVGYLIYTSVGILGYVSISNKKSIVKQSNTVMDYIPSDDMFVFVINVLLVFKYLVTSTVFIYTLAYQYKITFNDGNDLTNIQYQTISLSLVTTGAICGIFNIKPQLMIAVCGAIVSFALTYLFPYTIHLICLYKTECKEEKQLKKYKDPDTGDEEFQHLITDSGKFLYNSLCEQTNIQSRKTPKPLKLFLYSVLVCFGIYSSTEVLIGIFTKKQ